MLCPHVGSPRFLLTFKHLEGGETLRQLRTGASFEVLRSQANILSFRGSIGTTKLLSQWEGLKNSTAPTQDSCPVSLPL